MNYKLFRITKKLALIFFLALGYCLGGCATPSSVVVTRAGTSMDDGKLYVYLDGRQMNEKVPIGKGQTRTFPVSNGVHKIWVRVNSLESDKINFTAQDNTVTFNAATDRIGGTKYLLLERGTDRKEDNDMSSP